MSKWGRYQVVEIYVNCFWRIKTPEGKWMHADDLPLSFTDKAEAEEFCQKLNEQRKAEMASL